MLSSPSLLAAPQVGLSSEVVTGTALLTLMAATLLVGVLVTAVGERSQNACSSGDSVYQTLQNKHRSIPVSFFCPSALMQGQLRITFQA
jgi:hypothetical protein